MVESRERGTEDDSGYPGSISPEAGTIFRAEPGGRDGIAGRRGRGRTASAARTTAQAKKAPLDLGGIETLLLSAHAMLAGILSTPELELDKSEAKKISTALQEVEKHYPIGVNEKTMALTNLALVMGGIYGSRFMTYRMRMNMEAENAAEAKKAAQPNVMPFASR